MELEEVSLHYRMFKHTSDLTCVPFQTNPGQSQMVLMNSERFALLLAESIEVGSNRMVVSDNIGKRFS